MRRVLPADSLRPGWRPVPARARRGGDPLLRAARVRDRTDGKAVHLFGLALSRSWQLRLLAPHLSPERRERVLEVCERQVAAVDREIVSGDFMSTHWLVSFALLAATT